MSVVHKWKLSKTRENYSMMPSAQDWKKSTNSLHERKRKLGIHTRRALEKSITSSAGSVLQKWGGVGAIIM